MNSRPRADFNGSKLNLHPQSDTVHSALVHQLYSRGSEGHTGALIGAAVLTVSLWNLVPRLHLVLWLAAYVIVYITRLVLVKQYLKANLNTTDSGYWEKRFAVGTAAGGALWGLAAIFLFPESSVPHQYMLALFIAGITCGAVAFYWPSRIACLPAIFLELTPISGRFFFKGDETGIATGIVILFFLVVVSVMARNLRAFGVKSLELGLEKESLLDSLRNHQDELETRVEERTNELSRVNEALRHEIGERARAEESLSFSEERYRLVVDHAQESIFVAQDGRIAFANPAITELLGHSESELAAKPFIEFIHSDDRELVYQNHLRRLRGEQLPQRYSFRILDNSGAVRWVEISSVLIQWDERPAALVFMTEITDQREAEQALRESEERYRTFFDTSRDAVFMTTRDGRFLDFNDTALETLGYDPTRREDLLAMNVTDLYANPEEREAHAALVAKIGFSKEFPVDLRKRDGTIIHTLITTVTRRDPSGQIVGFQGTVRDITDRKRAEEALRESEERFRTLAESIPNIPVQGYDRNRTVVFWNGASEKLYGYKAEEALGKKLEDLIIPPDMRSDVIRSIQDWLDHGRQIMPGELGLMRKDGSIVPVYSSHAMVENGRGEKELYCVDVDLSELRQAEDGLRESEERFRKIFDFAPDAYFISDLQGRFLDGNRAAESLLGHRKDELIGKTFRDAGIIRSDQTAAAEELLKASAAGQAMGPVILALFSKEGQEVAVEISTFPINLNNQLVVLGIARDITERRKIEEALRESEEWYRSIVEESFDGIFVQQGAKIVYANWVLHEMLGYSAGELDGMDHWLIYHPDYQETIRNRALARMRGDKFSHEYEVKLLRKDGSVFDGEINAKAVKVQGKPGVRVWIRDISKRKRLEEVQKRLATAIEQSADAVVITDALGTVVYVNPAHEQITGYTREDVIGSLPPLFKTDEAELPPSGWPGLVARGGTWSNRTVGRRKDGTLYDVDVKMSPVRDVNGTIVNFVGLERDVTQEVHLQQQLLQAQKMEAVGTLAGGIAHDFNNLLQVVQGYSELLLAEKDRKDPEYDDLSKIFHAAKSGADLVHRLLMFSRKSEPKLAPMKLNQRIVAMERLLRRIIPRMIDIGLELSADLSDIYADSSQVEQVLLNLVVNARDAMTEGGTLTVRTSMARLDDACLRQSLESGPNRYVLLEVSDTGHGMDKETVEHIFEPFFTTKEMGRGTGLGLAIVHGIVEQHNGHLRVRSEIGTGTTFSVYLPALENESAEDVSDSGTMPAFGTETVLLVDDEDLVRELGARILAKRGYTVLQAVDGRKALDIFSKEHSAISLVILDLIMPIMGGVECLKGLRKIDPQVKVVVASGYSAETTVHETIELGVRGFVRKPFRGKELLREVRKVLDQKSKSGGAAPTTAS